MKEDGRETDNPLKATPRSTLKLTQDVRTKRKVTHTTREATVISPELNIRISSEGIHTLLHSKPEKIHF
jgi:hypothetical protein